MGAASGKLGAVGMLIWRTAPIGDAAPEAYSHGGGGECPRMGRGVGWREDSAASSSGRARGAGEACVQVFGGSTRADAKRGL
mmetsp:Transcript_31556/g.90515  ORF Transcript_31556/g.90515 Transcript_31556/m.90515 type:complete len:82 (-) Transcript_31556:910-1155(-)